MAKRKRRFNYRSTAERWDREATEAARAFGPKALKWYAALVAAAIVMGVVGYAGGWFGEAAAVVRQEAGPRALLRKYEWFKDAAAQLDRKRADIAVYAGRLEAIKSMYGDTPFREWDRTDRQQVSQWQAEVAGVTASYNGLAAEYNAQMAKINWAFANVGELPAGADMALPREYRSYEVK